MKEKTDQGYDFYCDRCKQFILADTNDDPIEDLRLPEKIYCEKCEALKDY